MLNVKITAIEPEKHIYLSLGSNTGDRLSHLQQAVQAIFEEVGSILKISTVYESPAMGFDGDPFLNCVVLITSTYTPRQLIQKVLKIEAKQGRVRQKGKGYMSRPIDIDILSIDKLEVNLDVLTVPHPQLHNRRFVLQPLADIDAEWVHPRLQKDVNTLLAETEDKTALGKQAAILKNPIDSYDLSPYNYIAIEGNIGAGKTSLATKLATDFNAKLILERFKDNPFLPKFYKDQQRYAFPLEMSFLADRYQQLLDDITQFDLFKDCVISDYDAYKSLIFAQVTLQHEEYNLYKKLFHLMHKELPKPDVYVYLYQNTERLLANIMKRGRKYEQSIPETYLQQLHTGYLEFIKTVPKEKLKVIDISEMDFIKRRTDYVRLLKTIVEK